MEYFGWHRFQNRNEVAALVGMTSKGCENKSEVWEQVTSLAPPFLFLLLAIFER
jgi:hypothetical protein